MSTAKRSSASFSLTAESTLMEDASSEEAIATKSIGANTFHHTMKNSIRIKHQRLLLSKLIMMDTISWIFRLSVMVELGESIVRDKCISQEELAQIDRHRQKSIFFLHTASIRTTRTIRCINNYLYKKINNYLHSSILLCIHLCIHAYIHTYIYILIHNKNYQKIYYKKVHASIHALIHTYIHSYIHASINPCIHIKIHASTNPYIHIKIHASIDTLMHKYKIREVG